MNEAVSPLLEASCLCFQDIALQSLKVTEISFMDYHGYGKAVGEKIKKKTLDIIFDLWQNNKHLDYTSHSLRERIMSLSRDCELFVFESPASWLNVI